MATNESTTDRAIRVIIGIVLLAAKLFGYVGGTLGLILAIVGVILLLTGLVGFCPLYRLLGISTCPVKSR
ncbi:MAG: DUF2892 domain-containing protein [Deinococcales bacterium]